MLARGAEVVGVDNLSGGELANVPAGVEFREADCRNFGLMEFAARRCELVFHCAATAYEGLSVFSPSFVTDNIVGSSVSVFSASIANRTRRIVFCSSMARYGAGWPPFGETDPVAPQDPYGIGKVAAETILANLCQTHDVEYAIAVPHNIIGPRQKFDDPYRNVAAIMINRMLQGFQPIVYGDGSQKRCFSWVGDCVACLEQLAFLAKANGETVNIGPDEQVITVLELAQRVARLLEFELDPIFVPGRPQEVPHAVCSADKARSLLGYCTTVDLDQALARMIADIRTRGPRPFDYRIPLEIVSERTPKTWTEKLI
jgi:UDP-glucose 4-epimerase